MAFQDFTWPELGDEQSQSASRFVQGHDESGQAFPNFDSAQHGEQGHDELAFQDFDSAGVLLFLTLISDVDFFQVQGEGGLGGGRTPLSLS